MHRFCLIHPCDGRTDRQTELRWLRRAIAVPAVARKMEHRAIPRKESLLVTLAFVTLGIGSIVLIEKSDGIVPCDIAANGAQC